MVRCNTHVNEYYRLLTPLYRRTPFGGTGPGKKELARFEMADWDHAKQSDVGWVIGAAMMMKRSVLNEIGLMDERFFLYYEDVDLCRRVWESGRRVTYVARAVMNHEHQRLSAFHVGFKSLFNYMTRVHVKSWIKYWLKYKGKLAVDMSHGEFAEGSGRVTRGAASGSGVANG